MFTARFIFVSFVLLCFASSTRFFQHRAPRTAVVWAEGGGGWWESECVDGRLFFVFFSVALLFMLLPFPLNQWGLVWETDTFWVVGGRREVSAEVVVLHLNRCHPEDGHASVSPWRQAEQQTHRWSSCCLASCPPTPPSPPPRPCTTLGTHMLPLCCFIEPASSTEGYFLYVCSIIQALWLVSRKQPHC